VVIITHLFPLLVNLWYQGIFFGGFTSKQQPQKKPFTYHSHIMITSQYSIDQAKDPDAFIRSRFQTDTKKTRCLTRINPWIIVSSLVYRHHKPLLSIIYIITINIYIVVQMTINHYMVRCKSLQITINRSINHVQSLSITIYWYYSSPLVQLPDPGRSERPPPGGNWCVLMVV
jgi:hypothetical protein